MLDIQHLTKTYGEKKAVDDLSLRIAPGEIYGFIGHNGAGKTTLLQILGTLSKADRGSVEIDEEHSTIRVVKGASMITLDPAAVADRVLSDIRSGKIPPEQWPEVLPQETLRVVQENHLYSAEKEV